MGKSQGLYGSSQAKSSPEGDEGGESGKEEDERGEEKSRRKEGNPKGDSKKGWIPKSNLPSDGEEEKVWGLEGLKDPDLEREAKAGDEAKRESVPTKGTERKMENLDGKRGEKGVQETRGGDPSGQEKVARRKGENPPDGPRQGRGRKNPQKNRGREGPRSRGLGGEKLETWTRETGGTQDLEREKGRETSQGGPSGEGNPSQSV